MFAFQHCSNMGQNICTSGSRAWTHAHSVSKPLPESNDGRVADAVVLAYKIARV